MPSSRARLAIIALIVANIIWGASPPIFKWTLEEIGPYTLAFLRFAIPALIMYPFVRKKLKIDRKDYIGMLLVGLLGITVNITFFFQGLLRAPSINSALIISSAPVFIILISLLFMKEKPKKKLIFGSLIGLLGVILVLVTPLFQDGVLTSMGNFFFLISMFAIAASILLTRKVMKRNSPVAVTFWTFAIGSIGFLPFLLGEIQRRGFMVDVTSQGYFGLLFGIFLTSLLAYYLHTWALKYLTASDVSVFAYIDPVVTIFVAIPLLGEYPNMIFAIGTFLVLGGILIAEGRLHYHPFHLLLKK